MDRFGVLLGVSHLPIFQPKMHPSAQGISKAFYVLHGRLLPENDVIVIKQIIYMLQRPFKCVLVLKYPSSTLLYTHAQGDHGT